MRTITADWAEKTARGEFTLKTIAMINNKMYDTITAPVIKSALISDNAVSVGNCIASTLEFTVMTTDVIPKSAQVVIKCCLDTTDTDASAIALATGTQASITNNWTGNANIDALEDGQRILYYLPFRSNGLVRLNLTMNDGTTTLYQYCYYMDNGSVRQVSSNTYSAGDIILMTYREHTQINGTYYTGWFTEQTMVDFGTFWINERTTDDDLTTLVCYDAMLMGNQVYSDDAQALEWPKAMTTVVTRIAQQMGVAIDSRTVIHTGGDYECTKPNSDDTLLTVLGYIAGVHGGNWIITPENKLRLVPLVSPPDDSFDVVDYDSDRIRTAGGYKLVHELANDGGVHEGARSTVHPAGGGLVNVPVVIGTATTGQAYTISRVTMTNNALQTGSEEQSSNESEEEPSNTYTAGDDTGYNLIVPDNPYATQTLCNALYAELNGVEYAPFNITGACFNPAAELGDWVIAGDIVRSVIFQMEQTFDINYSADISAPGSDEIESEYPYQTATEKLQYTVTGLKADNEAVRSEIRQAMDTIALSVTKGDLRSAFELGIIDDGVDPGIDVRSYIRMQADTIQWSSNNSIMTSTGVLKCRGAKVIGNFEATASLGNNYYITTRVKDGRLELMRYSTSGQDEWLDNVTEYRWSSLYYYKNLSSDTTNYAVLSAFNGTRMRIGAAENADSPTTTGTYSGTKLAKGPYIELCPDYTADSGIHMNTSKKIKLESTSSGITLNANTEINLNCTGLHFTNKGQTHVWDKDQSKEIYAITAKFWYSYGNNDYVLDFVNGLLVGHTGPEIPR